MKAKGDKYLVECVPDDATEVLYSQKYPVTGFGWMIDGVSYKVNPEEVSERVEDIFEEKYPEGYEASDNNFIDRPYYQWIESEENEYDVKINKKLLGDDNFEDYRVVYIDFANGTDTQVFVNEKTGRFIHILVNH